MDYIEAKINALFNLNYIQLKITTKIEYINVLRYYLS